MKKYYFLSVILAALFFACSKENSAEELLPQQDGNKNEHATIGKPFLYDGIYEIRDGKEVDLTHTQSQTRVTHEFYDITIIEPRYAFLGSVLTKQSVNDGIYALIGNANEWKRQITISFSLPVMSTKIAPSKSGLRNAVVAATHDKDFSGKQSQVFSYKMKEFSYYKELKLAFGANVNISKFFSVDVNVNSGKIKSKTALFAEFSQIYFSVDMDFPDDGNIFLNENIRQKYLPQKPVYMGTINYGRKGIIMVESSSNYETLSVAVRAAFNAKIVNGKLSLDTKHEEVLKQAQIQICIIGGDGQGAAKTAEGFHAFQEFIIKGGVYSKEVFGVPISFSAAYAENNGMFVTEFDL